MEKTEAERRYRDAVSIIVNREITDIRTRVPVRVEAYLLQAVLGKRPLNVCLKKISHALKWAEKKDPEFYREYTTPDPVTKLSPYMELRHEIIAPGQFAQLLGIRPQPKPRSR